ncbi:MAG TPA: FHA domain-containing protein [Novosphingobium sp.]|nr:FHA domain-containing protein [Novosphingobium sp.]
MPLILAVRNSGGIPGEAIAPMRIERGEIVVGRGEGAHLLVASQSVSRRHCTVSGDGPNWRIVDTSSGGTFVNGQRITAPHFLRHGDVIRVGEVEIAAMIEAAAPAPAADGWGRPVTAPPTTPRAASGWGTAHTAPPGAGDAVGTLLQAAGLSRGQAGASDQQVAAIAGAALRAALAGLARLAQDRRKARDDLGIAGGGIDAADSAEELLPRLLAGSPADAAAQVNALCADIDAHQRAVLGAMQATLHHALDQFSPASIKNSARGDAEAWKAYERAFDARDGFVEVFAQALSKQYGDAVRAS